MLAGLFNVAAALLGAAGLAGLAGLALRDHRAAQRWRSALLDDTARLFHGRAAIGPDGFPHVAGWLPDGRRIMVSLLPDTLVVRRLPQLWLIVTLHETEAQSRPSIGALARSTGAEFYALVPELPDRLESPSARPDLLIRGAGRLGPEQNRRCFAELPRLFSDPQLKEAVVCPGGVRVVRQVAEGERGEHLLLRQAYFPNASISAAMVTRCIDDADALRAAMDGPAKSAMRLSA